MSSKIWRSLVAMRVAAKSPAYSASATNEQMTGIRVEWAEIGWLRGGIIAVVTEEVMASGVRGFEFSIA